MKASPMPYGAGCSTGSVTKMKIRSCKENDYKAGQCNDNPPRSKYGEFSATGGGNWHIAVDAGRAWNLRLLRRGWFCPGSMRHAAAHRDLPLLPARAPSHKRVPGESVPPAMNGERGVATQPQPLARHQAPAPDRGTPERLTVAVGGDWGARVRITTRDEGVGRKRFFRHEAGNSFVVAGRFHRVALRYYASLRIAPANRMISRRISTSGRSTFWP